MVSSLDFQRNRPYYSIVNAALLLADKDPSMCDKWDPSGDLVLSCHQKNERLKTFNVKSIKFKAAFNRLAEAVYVGEIPATRRYPTPLNPMLFSDLTVMGAPQMPEGTLVEYVTEEDPDTGEKRRCIVGETKVGYQEPLDWETTTVKTEDLREWLKKNEIESKFFFPDETGNTEELPGDKISPQTPKELSSALPPYLDPENKYYSPELAVLVKTWLDLYHEKKVHVPRQPENKECICKHLIESYGLELKDHGVKLTNQNIGVDMSEKAVKNAYLPKILDPKSRTDSPLSPLEQLRKEQNKLLGNM